MIINLSNYNDEDVNDITINNVDNNTLVIS